MDISGGSGREYFPVTLDLKDISHLDYPCMKIWLTQEMKSSRKN